MMEQAAPVTEEEKERIMQEVYENGARCGPCAHKLRRHRKRRDGSPSFCLVPFCPCGGYRDHDSRGHVKAARKRTA